MIVNPLRTVDVDQTEYILKGVKVLHPLQRLGASPPKNVNLVIPRVDNGPATFLGGGYLNGASRLGKKHREGFLRETSSVREQSLLY